MTVFVKVEILDEYPPDSGVFKTAISYTHGLSVKDVATILHNAADELETTE